jgi:hypothetical protein
MKRISTTHLLADVRRGLKPRILAALASAWFLVASSAQAQSGGTITGHVVDETEGVLPGVTVDLHSDGMETFVVTGETGEYRIDNVPPGRRS